MAKRECVKTGINGGNPGVTPYFIDLTKSGTLTVARHYCIVPNEVNRVIRNY